MGSKIKKKDADKKKSAVEKRIAESVYADEVVKNYAYADYVKLQTSIRGMLLSFGKVHPDDKKVRLYHEVLLPLDVAHNLIQIMNEQFDSLKRQNVIKVQNEEGE